MSLLTGYGGMNRVAMVPITKQIKCTYPPLSPPAFAVEGLMAGGQYQMNWLIRGLPLTVNMQ